jgi:hypothetical protein
VEKAAQTMEVEMKLSMAVAYWGSFMVMRREPSLADGWPGGRGGTCRPGCRRPR